MKSVLVAFSLVVLIGVGRTVTAAPVPVPAPQAAPTQAEGMAILRASCVHCHDIEQVTDTRQSPADWDATLKRMVGQGASVSPADYAKLRAFLVANYSDAPAP